MIESTLNPDFAAALQTYVDRACLADCDEPSTALFHLIAGAFDWCDEKGVDFNAEVLNVRQYRDETQPIRP